MANFVVTGHLGYIGCHVVDLLKRQGHYVRGIDIDLYAGEDFDRVPEAHQTLIKDVMDVTPQDFAGTDAVIHLAALSNDPLGQLDPEWTYRVNYHGTLRVAECAREAGVGRMVFSSSCSLYGASGDHVVTEEDPGDPITAYGETKLLSEQGLAEMADERFSPVVLRNATAYGASPRLRLDIVLNNLAAWGYATGEIRVISDGTPWRPLVHCRDIARAAITVALADREIVHNQVFNFGRSDSNYRVRELVEVAAKAVGNCSALYTGEGSPDSRDYRVNFDKFRTAFPDFDFLHDVESGAQELVREYGRYGLSLADLEGQSFVRLRSVKQRIAEMAWSASASGPS